MGPSDQLANHLPCICGLLTASVHYHQSPSVDIVDNGLEALPASHAAMRLRTVITIQSGLGDGLLTERQERRREGERWEEEQGDERHDDSRDGFDLRAMLESEQ